MHANVCPATSFGPKNMKSMWNSLIWWSSFFARKVRGLHPSTLHTFLAPIPKW